MINCIILSSHSLAVTVSFEMAEYMVLESAGIQTVCVELTSGTVERRVVVSVDSSNAGAEGKLSLARYTL